MMFLQVAAQAVQTAVQSATAGVSPAEPTAVNNLLSTFTAATFTVSIIEWLKATKLVPFINQHSAGINRTISWISAFATGAGIHFTFNHDAGVLTVTGLSAGVVIHSVTVTMQQYAAQWAIYKAIVQPRAETVAAIAEGVRPIPVASPGTIAAANEQTPKP